MEDNLFFQWKIFIKCVDKSMCCGLVAQSCSTICDHMDCSPPSSSANGVFQARILEWVAISFSRGSSQSRDWTQVSHIAGRFFTVWATCTFAYKVFFLVLRLTALSSSIFSKLSFTIKVKRVPRKKQDWLTKGIEEHWTHKENVLVV